MKYCPLNPPPIEKYYEVRCFSIEDQHKFHGFLFPETDLFFIKMHYNSRNGWNHFGRLLMGSHFGGFWFTTFGFSLIGESQCILTMTIDINSCYCHQVYWVCYLWIQFLTLLPILNPQHVTKSLFVKWYTSYVTTDKTRMPAFWGYHLPPHDYPYRPNTIESYWIPSQDKVKVTNLKNLPKLEILK